MADGRITIDTKIETKGAKESLESLEYQIKKSAEYINELKKKMDALANQETPTKEYEDLQNKLSDAENNLSGLVAQQEEWESLGVVSGDAWDTLNENIAKASDNVDSIKEKMQELVDSGKAFTFGSETAEYASYERQIKYEERAIEEAKKHYNAIIRNEKIYERLKNTASSAIERIKNAFSKVSGQLVRSSKSTLSIGTGLKTILKYSLGIRSLYALVNKLRSALVEGFKNLAQYSTNTNAALSGLMSSLSQCKNALATAFDPILQAIAPALNYMISLVTAAATAVAQLIAILTGKGTFIKATKVQKDYAKSLKGTGGAAKGAGEDAEGALAPFDKLNVLAEEGAGGGGGGGGGAGSDIGDMFETVEVEDSFKGIGKVLTDLFKPFKEAWDKYGKTTVDAAKYALSSLGELAKSVGKSFMEVWTNGTGTKVISEILQIATNLFLIVGNIAKKLREAWEANNVGTRIIQNVFNIFLSILDTIRRITESTAEWAAKLDFTPLLESINTLLEAIKPLTDTIGEGLEWFWNKVLLPISKWTIEDAVPTFLDMLSSAIKALDEVIDAFKPAGKWLWEEFLEPLGKWTGEKLIEAIKKVTELFEKFGNWITEHKEEVFQFGIIVGTIAAAFIAVNGAIALVTAALPVLTGLITTLIGVITGPAGIIAALAAMVVATGNGNEMIEKLKQTLEGLKDFIVGVFTLDWEKAWDGAKKAVTGAVDAIKIAIESVMQVIDLLMGKVDSLGEVEVTQHKPSRSVNVKGAKYKFRSLSVMGQGYSSEPVHLPRLASGTVVPPRAGEFAAILRDNRREAEIVSPLSTMEKAMGNVLQKYGSIGGGDINLTVNLDGRVVYQDVIKRNQMEKSRTGINPLLA